MNPHIVEGQVAVRFVIGKTDLVTVGLEAEAEAVVVEGIDSRDVADGGDRGPA